MIHDSNFPPLFLSVSWTHNELSVRWNSTIKNYRNRTKNDWEMKRWCESKIPKNLCQIQIYESFINFELKLMTFMTIWDGKQLKETNIVTTNKKSLEKHKNWLRKVQVMCIINRYHYWSQIQIRIIHQFWLQMLSFMIICIYYLVHLYSVYIVVISITIHCLQKLSL